MPDVPVIKLSPLETSKRTKSNWLTGSRSKKPKNNFVDTTQIESDEGTVVVSYDTFRNDGYESNGQRASHFMQPSNTVSLKNPLRGAQLELSPVPARFSKAVLYFSHNYPDLLTNRDFQVHAFLETEGFLVEIEPDLSAPEALPLTAQNWNTSNFTCQRVEILLGNNGDIDLVIIPQLTLFKARKKLYYDPQIRLE